MVFTLTMDMAALSCAAARYVCRQDIRTFASGLQMDVSALSALQLAMLVGRRFEWILLRCTFRRSLAGASVSLPPVLL